MNQRGIKSVRWMLLCLLPAISATVTAANWKKLSDDDIHDPSNPALELLQNPEESLKLLPGDTAGNKVDWIRALQNGYIQPRSRIKGEAEEEILDLDVVMMGTGAGSVPFIRFPHKSHTEWLACSNCHEHLFKSEAGATKFTMLEILNGESCGVCHGAVSFPLTECNRCHSVPRDEAMRAQRERQAEGKH